MNEIIEPIVPVESWADVVKRVLGTIGGVMLLGMFVGCLFAPIFGNFIEDRLMRDPDGSYVRMSRMPDIARKMLPIRIGLWVISIAAWSALILLNLFWKYGN